MFELCLRLCVGLGLHVSFNCSNGLVFALALCRIQYLHLALQHNLLLLLLLLPLLSIKERLY